MSEPIDTSADNAPPKNPAAVALGRMGRGKPKTLSHEERERRKASARAMGRGNAKVKETTTL